MESHGMSHRVATDPDVTFACGRALQNCGIGAMPSVYPPESASLLMSNRVIDSPVFHANAAAATAGRMGGHVINGHVRTDPCRPDPVPFDNLIDLSPSRRLESSNDSNVADVTAHHRIYDGFSGAAVPFGIISQSSSGGGGLPTFNSTSAWQGLS